MPESIIPVAITEKLQNAYLDYAMSVIVSRALPDVRDGLKPVQRRILFSMWQLGLKSNARFTKSARVVGEVIGKYHPHGDAPVYDALARLAQDFSLRYPLIRGQGNFGSMDGDPPAAMRYTEAKMTALAEEMLEDIDRDTVDWSFNYDGTLKEPDFLPARAPQLLLNGTRGIAVGMATNIPPHNVGEVVDALVHLIDNPDSSTEDIMEFIQGPDFPTGGYIYDKAAITQAYGSGRGAITTRARADIEEDKNGNESIIINQLTYLTNKASLIKSMADLVTSDRITGVKDIRDESDKNGIRIVVDVKRGMPAGKLLNQLYSMTELQKEFHLNMIALVNGIEPRVLSIKEVLSEYLKHRVAVVRRRSTYDLEQARARAHILEGLHKALGRIDEVIATIKKSSSREDAKINLVNTFRFTPQQAEAILETKLHRLARLGREEIEKELKEKRELIRYLLDLLAHEQKIYGVIKTELAAFRKKYQDERMTELVNSSLKPLTDMDLVPKEEILITFTEKGYFKRVKPDTYKAQHRGGKGIIGAKLGGGDSVRDGVLANTHDDILLFSRRGVVYCLKGYEVPEKKREQKGELFFDAFSSSANPETLAAILALPEKRVTKESYLVLVTKYGKIKKTPLEHYDHISRAGLIAINIGPDDELRFVAPATDEHEVLLVTKNGQSIHFGLKSIRAQGRRASGVRAIRLKKNDAVIGVTLVAKGTVKTHMLTVTTNGYAKCSPLSEFRVQNRGGLGIRAHRVTPKTGEVASACMVAKDVAGELIVISRQGKVLRTRIKDIPELGRSTQGVRVIRLEADDKVARAVSIS